MTKEITAITAQKRNPSRLNISLDGEYAFSLDRLTAAWLTIGRKLSPQDIETLKARDEQEVAFNRALRYLSFRARSEQEISDYLRGKGFCPAVIETVINRLKDERLINDQDFAMEWIDNRVNFRPRSQTLLRMELRRKGVNETTIEESILKSDLDDTELAKAAGKKLARRYQALPWEDFRRKLSAALSRRGFNYETAATVTKVLWKEIQAEATGREK